MFSRRLLPASRLFRVPDWFHVLGLPVLGFAFIHSRAPGTGPARLFPLVALGALYLLHGYAFNETFDTLYAAKGSRADFLIRKGIPFREALAFSLAPLCAAVALASLLSPVLCALVIGGAILSWLYSAPPLRLKAIPFADLAVNSLGFSLLFLIGAWGPGPDARSLLSSGLVFIVFIALQLIHEIVHLDEDRGLGTMTTAVRYGPRVAASLTLVSLALLICWSLFLWAKGFSFLLCLLACGLSAAVSPRVLPLILVTQAGDRRLRLHTRAAAALYGAGLLVAFLLP